MEVGTRHNSIIFLAPKQLSIIEAARDTFFIYFHDEAGSFVPVSPLLDGLGQSTTAFAILARNITI